MVKSIYESASSAGTAYTGNIISYEHITGLPSGQSTSNEANSQDLVRSAGTLSSLYVNVRVNPIAATSTVIFRKNGADGNLTISIGSSATGEFEDLTHNDTVVSGDLVCWKFTPGNTTAGISLNTHTAIFDNNQSSTITSTPLGCTAGNTATAMTGASTTYFVPINGQLHSTAAVTSEAIVKTQFRKTGTMRNLRVKIVSNSRTTTTTVKTRKNGADGNQVVTIGSTATGFFEDTTHTDSVAVNDQLNYTVVNGTGTSAISYASLFLTFDNTDYPGVVPFLTGGTNASNTINSNQTVRSGPFGLSFFSTNNEANARTKIRNPYTISDLSVTVGANSIAATSTFTFVKNATTTAITVTITSSGTGIFSDTTHTVSMVSGDMISVQMVVGGLSGTMLLQAYSLFATTNVPLQSYTISESAITASAASLAEKVIRLISESSITASAATIARKVTIPISESSITAAAATVVKKAVKKISETAITISASVAATFIPGIHYINEPSITAAAATVVRKVIRPLNESSIAATVTVTLRKVTRPVVETAITVTNTLKLKVIRPVNEPAKTVSSSVALKVVRKINEPSVTVGGSSVLLKIKRVITTTSVSVSDSITTRFYKAVRSTSNTVSASAATIVTKTTRPISEPPKSVSSSVSAHKFNAVTVNEPSTSASAASITTKVTRPINEPAKSASSAINFVKTLRNISEATINAVSSIVLKVKRNISESGITVGAATLTRKYTARRNISESVSVSDSVIKSSGRLVTVNEPAINSILDTVQVTRVKRYIAINEPPITVGGSTALAQRNYFRSVNEHVSVNDSLATTKIEFNKKYTFKHGLKYIKRVTDDTKIKYE